MEGPWNGAQAQAAPQPVATATAVPPPPVFGFQPRDDTINLEDIFSDWFADELGALNAPVSSQPTIVQAVPPQSPQQPPQQPIMYNQQPQGVQYGQPMPYMVQPQYPQAQGAMQPGQQQPQPQQPAYPSRMPAPMVMPQSQMQPMQHQQPTAIQPRMMAQQPMMVPAPTQQAPPLVQGKPVVYPNVGTAKTTMPKGMSGGWEGGGEEDGEDEEEDDDDDDEDGTLGDKKKKRPRSQTRRMTEEQKVERRERNREHAKRSRVRKKFLLDSLQKSVNALQEENDKLKTAIRGHLKEQAEGVLMECKVDADDSLITSDPNSATKILDDPDYTLVKALQTAQQNFVITDPSLPDNPIVYASQGFLSLTGYSMEQILGRNCRFLQGPDTDPDAVDKIRRAIEEGVDGSVCLLNYREDGTTFWNQFFIAALRGADGNIVNYVGVQCKVSEEYAKEVLRAEKEKEAADAAAAAGGGGGGVVKKEGSSN